jgi:hypothetical protein
MPLLSRMLAKLTLMLFWTPWISAVIEPELSMTMMTSTGSGDELGHDRLVAARADGRIDALGRAAVVGAVEVAEVALLRGARDAVAAHVERAVEVAVAVRRVVGGPRRTPRRRRRCRRRSRAGAVRRWRCRWCRTRVRSCCRRWWRWCPGRCWGRRCRRRCRRRCCRRPRGPARARRVDNCPKPHRVPCPCDPSRHPTRRRDALSLRSSAEGDPAAPRTPGARWFMRVHAAGDVGGVERMSSPVGRGQVGGRASV